MKLKKNVRKLMVDALTEVCEGTSIKISIEGGYINIDIVDEADNKIILMDKAYLPYLRKDFSYRYKHPVITKPTLG